jgi:hypothetical protein
MDEAFIADTLLINFIILNGGYVKFTVMLLAFNEIFEFGRTMPLKFIAVVLFSPIGIP